MAWIFNEAAKKGDNPWSWFWGSPETQSGHRKCGCRRSEVCQCWRRKKNKGYKWEETSAVDSAPPVARTHSADAICRIPVQTFESAARHPNARIVDHPDVDDLLLDDTLNQALVYIQWNVNDAPKECLFHAILNDPGKCKEMMRDVPAHDNTPFMSPYYDGDETMDGHPSPPIYNNNYHDDDATPTTTDDATAADAKRSSRCEPFRFTFFTSAKYPKAKIAPSYAGDAMMWQHFKGKNTFDGVRVYIESNASDGVCFRAAGASAHDVDAQDTRLQPTFMSLAENPRAVLQGGKSQDWILTQLFESAGTFVGAQIYIVPGTDLGDRQQYSMLKETEWTGKIGDASVNRDGCWQ
jgi:hypothetical protein